jgi:hypothetical protein
MISSTRTVQDYETLRAAVLGTGPVRGQDLGLLRHRGLASWLKTPASEPVVKHSCTNQDPTPNVSVDPALPTSELIHLIVGIVVALAAEPAHG